MYKSVGTSGVLVRRLRHTEEVGSTGNASDLYSRGARNLDRDIDYPD
jgi:hypothetical protein